MKGTPVSKILYWIVAIAVRPQDYNYINALASAEARIPTLD